MVSSSKAPLISKSNSRIEAVKVVFSLAEVLLLIERGKKNAAFAASNSNLVE